VHPELLGYSARLPLYCTSGNFQVVEDSWFILQWSRGDVEVVGGQGVGNVGVECKRGDP
jgi:hypothetical protein